MPYSVTKPFAALCGLVLADRGLLDLDAPLSTYWPELLAPTTMRQVLSHQSGLALLERPAPEEAFYDWDLMCRLVAEQPPLWEPGTACGESALLYGHQIGEVVRASTAGRSAPSCATRSAHRTVWTSTSASPTPTSAGSPT